MPTYSEMITAAIFALKQRGGSSRKAIADYVKENNARLNLARLNYNLRSALKRGVEKGIFIQIKQSFKLSAEQKKIASKIDRGEPCTAKRKKKTKASGEIDNTRAYVDEVAREVDSGSDGRLPPDLAMVVAEYTRGDVMLDIEIGRPGHKWRAFRKKCSLPQTMDSVGQWICGNDYSFAQRRFMNPEVPYTVKGRQVAGFLRLGSVLHSAGVSWETLTSGKFIISAFQGKGKYGSYDITFIADRYRDRDRPFQWYNARVYRSHPEWFNAGF